MSTFVATRRTPKLLLLAGASVAAVVCIPLLYLVFRASSGGIENVLETLARPRIAEVIATTVLLAISVAGTTVAIGVPLAWWLVRARIPLRPLWIVLLTLPLAVPSFAAAFAWVSLIPGMQGFFGAWLVLSLSTIPYVILPTAASLRGIDPAHEEVARTLGFGPVAAFRKACFPQLLPAVGGGSLLVILYVLSDFGAVSIMRVDTLSRAIFVSYRASFDRTSAAVLALILALLAILVVWIEQRARGRARRWRLATSAPRHLNLVRLTSVWSFGLYAVSAAVVVLGLLVPIFASLSQIFEGSSRGLDSVDLGQALGTTILYGFIGMLAAMLLAVPIGLLVTRYPTRSSLTIERLSFVGQALPGVVVGLAIVFVGARLTPMLYQTLVMLAFAYAILFLPKAGAAIRGSLAGVPPVLEDVARTLGDSPLRAFVRTTLRLAMPGVLAGAVLVFLTVMKELPATLMLRPTGQDTLATRLWALTDAGYYAAAAPYALALIALGAIPAAILAVPLVRSTKEVKAQAAAQTPQKRVTLDG